MAHSLLRGESGLLTPHRYAGTGVARICCGLLHFFEDQVRPFQEDLARCATHRRRAARPKCNSSATA